MMPKVFEDARIVGNVHNRLRCSIPLYTSGQ